MPWIGKVLERVPPKMSGQLHLNVLTFVPSVGMIMNGDFIDYRHV